MPTVNRKHENVGTGGLITFTGMDRAEVVEAAEIERDTIDTYRSPCLTKLAERNDQGEFVVTIRYYGLN